MSEITIKKYLDGEGLKKMAKLFRATFATIEDLNKKCSVEVCDNQYEFDQILTKDNNTIYLIKGDQDTWFSKEDGDELWDNYGLLLERVKILERLAGLSEYDPEDENNPDIENDPKDENDPN